MLRENASIVVTRNERWQGGVLTEPVECGWASEAIFFVRMLGGDRCDDTAVRVEISADGMHWASEGTAGTLPMDETEMSALRVSHFGNWLRLAVDVPDGLEFLALVTLHLK
jgi:hypothetical protein